MTLDKLSLLLWKNLKIQSRKKCQMFFEILVPVLCCVVLLLLFFSLKTVDNTNEISDTRSTKIILAYSPKNKYVEEYVQKTGMDVIGLADKFELQQYSKKHKPFAEITFNQSLKEADALPNNLEYSLRFNLNINDPSQQSEQFMKLQNTIERSFVAFKSRVQELPRMNIKLKALLSKKTNTFTQHILPLFIIIGFTGVCISVVKHIMIEKEMQLKESLKMLGLSNTVQWLAWFTKFMIMLVIICTVATIIFKIEIDNQIFPQSNAILLWVFLFLYSSSLVTFAFMLTTFFSKPNLAATVSGIFFFLTYFPYHIISSNYGSVGLITKLLCSLFLNSGMALGIKVITDHESDGHGAKWKNLFSSPNYDNICLFYILVMFIISTSIHVLITLYVERVFPGDFGVAEKWDFPFRSSHTSDEETISDTRSSVIQEDVEAVPIELKPTIEIRNLSKSFSNGLMAIENLNLTIYENQITVLLGKNGAGKTTMMSILTGLYAQTSGSITIDGKDITTNMNSIRKSMGLCPQNNVLFHDLTVKEHIVFFCRLKGMKIRREIDEEITKYTTLLMLTPKMNALSKTLSGGMKRKLAFAIAFCGKPKVVLFDEPTTGMDPGSRKVLWDLLMKEKIGKTIVLSTHYMDEAELGDRIAILANGRLRACGSTFYLKKRFGVGYRLVCVKEDGCNTQDVTKQLGKFIPKIECETDIGSELYYLLSDEFVNKFQSIFEKLEDKMESLKIASFGVSLTTLEEVFLKIDTADLRDSIISAKSERVSVSILNLNLGSPSLLKGWKLLMNQSLAMVYKKFLYTLRNYIFVLVQFLTPFVSVLSKIVQDARIKRTTKSTSYFQILDTTNLVENINIVLVKDELPDGGYEEKMYNYLLKQKNIFPNTGTSENLIEAFFSKGNVTALYNNVLMGPVTVNLMNNALLKGLTGNDDLRIHLLKDTNPYNSYTVDSDSNASVLSSPYFNMAIKIVVTLSLVTAMFITFYIKELALRFKLLQFVSSVNVVIFWITSFLFDYLLFFLIALIYVFGFGGTEYFMKMYNLMLFFGFAMLPFTYFSSFLFKVSSNGLSRLVMFNLLTGLVLPLVTLMVEVKLRLLASMLNWMFSIFPFYSLVMGICSIDKDIDKYLGILFVSGCFFSTMVIALEYKWIQKIFWRYKKQFLKPRDKNIDSDVGDENERVHKMNREEISGHKLVLKDVTKCYGKVLAVNRICLEVNKGECFGLLGVNGAGKTSIFKMLIGDQNITSGDAWVRGLSMRHEMHNVYKYTGYCPQNDALLEDLTGRETMVMFLLIKGFLLRDVYFLSEYWAFKLNFYEYLDKPVSKLSLGIKRKLSVALAFIGDPTVIFLDEPSSGMDPSAKRKVWNTIIESRNAGKSVMLSTHSMDECEALCTRLAVMINGQFHCLGSIQKLKDKFSKGFFLVIKVLQNDDKAIRKTWIEMIKTFVFSTFVDSYLQDKQQNMLFFHIPMSDMKLSLMFGMIENAKEELNIADYSLSQTSINQVFLYLSKKAAMNL